MNTQNNLASRLTSIQRADLFRVEYGYDAVGNRRFTRNLTAGLEDRSELYEYDQRYRLRRLDRGTISGGGDPVPELLAPIAADDLASALAEAAARRFRDESAEAARAAAA